MELKVKEFQNKREKEMMVTSSEFTIEYNSRSISVNKQTCILKKDEMLHREHFSLDYKETQRMDHLIQVYFEPKNNTIYVKNK